MNILEYKDKIENGTSSKELWQDAVNKSKSAMEKLNPYVTIMDEYISLDSESKLNGVPYSIKDNFSTKGILTTGSSNILKDYIPPFDSTVYKKLKQSGAALVGKTVLDELAMGGSGLTGHTGIVRNPYDTTRIAGGSSAGSVVSVAANLVPFSIGSDTGDSVRKPSSYCGVVGFKPTYGRISRYGLFPFASSLDHVGVITRNVLDAAIVVDVLKGKDKMDMTTLEDDNISYSDNLVNDLKGKKLFYIKEIVDKENVNNEETIKILDNFYEKVNDLKERGALVEEVSIDKKLLECIYPIYFIISCAESTSNNSNLTGFIFGNKMEGKTPEEIMINTRTKGFAEMIKRRFVIGSYILERENQERLFINAKRARNMIVTKINELLSEHDALILPTTGTVAPKINPTNEPDRLSSEYLLLENHLDIGNFGGYPSITIPCGFVNDMPIGLSITCKQREDLKCLNIAYSIESTMPYKDMIKEVI